MSDLVTSNGNYYAVRAEVSELETKVELITYLAATPTKDPEEATIWSDTVDAELTPRLFAFESDEHYLDVEKAPEETMYRGEMSGQTQFGDVVEVTCWPVDLEHPARYEPETGACVDEEGTEVQNDIPWMVALRTGFGQCTSFEGALAGETTSATFDFIDLRGADFSGATFRNTTVQEVQLEGADLSEATIENASISGSMDEHTGLPEDCQIEEDGTSFTCVR